MKTIHEFEIRMMQFEKRAYFIASLLFLLIYIITKNEYWALCSIFYIQPIFMLGLMDLFKTSKKLRMYFLHRAKKSKQKTSLKNEGIALLLIAIESIFIRNIKWYTVIISIILGMIFEYIRNLVQVKQNYIIE